MWGTSQCPGTDAQVVFPPQPPSGQARGAFLAWWERGRVPRGWPSLVLVCHSPAVSPRPGTGRPWALPGTQRGIEGHSRALSPVPAAKGPVALCRLPWPSAASTAAGDQGHPREPWHPWDVGHPRDRTAPATALGPWGATGVPTRMPLPHGGHGAGQSSCKIPIKKGENFQFGAPKAESRLLRWEPLFPAAR